MHNGHRYGMQQRPRAGCETALFSASKTSAPCVKWDARAVPWTAAAVPRQAAPGCARFLHASKTTAPSVSGLGRGAPAAVTLGTRRTQRAHTNSTGSSVRQRYSGGARSIRSWSRSAWRHLVSGRWNIAGEGAWGDTSGVGRQSRRWPGFIYVCRRTVVILLWRRGGGRGEALRLPKEAPRDASSRGVAITTDTRVG